MEFKNFIVPTDFSEESLKGLDLAILFAQKIHVNIQMVYVQKSSADFGQVNIDLEKEHAEKAFEKLIAKYTPQLKNDSSLRYIIKRGKIFKEVVNQSESFKDCIITASTHGASGFEELFIGSNAYKIISSTTDPVITIRKGNCPKSFKKIVLPIDKSEDSRQKVPFVRDLATLFKAEVHVLALNTTKDQKTVNRVKAYANQVIGFMTDKIHCTFEELFGDNSADLVVDYSNKIKADLIAIMTDQASGISLIIGNDAHRVITNSTIPVLSLTRRELRRSGSFSTFGG